MPKSKEFLSSSSSEDSESEPKQKKQKKEKSKDAKNKNMNEGKSSSEAIKGDDGESMYPLSRNRNISVSEFHGKMLVNIREYYEKDGKLLPGRKGISLSREQWDKLKSYIPDIDSQLSK